MATIKKAQNVFKVMFKKNEAEIKEEIYFTMKYTIRFRNMLKAE
jgi:hypothetical protein